MGSTKIIKDVLTADDKSFLEEFVNLKSLSIIGLGLTKLQFLPDLPKLDYLDLSDNFFTGEEL
jgi:hypothetical protein